jgi:acetyl-CoA acetyltransferase
VRKVAIVGVGTIPWRSRYEECTWQDLGLQVTKKALNDAHIGVKDVDSVVYSIYCDLMMRQQSSEPLIQDYLGLEGKPCVRVMAGATGEMYALYAAFSQIASGMADIVLLPAIQKGQDWYSFETRSRGDGLLKGFSISTNTTWMQPVVPGVPVFLTATFIVPHVEKYGTPTPEQLGKASSKNHKNALVNPEAQLKIDVSAKDVMNSRIISWPTTMYQCCLYSDCAAALILASEEKAKALTDTPIWISGVAVSSYLTTRFESDNLGRLIAVEEAGRRAYKMAGIKNPLHELDVMEVHDLITGCEILMYEELGLCGPGEGGRLVDEGVVEKTGLLPVNPSGGRVAAGHVGGVSGLYSTACVTRQLKEQAGAMQVPLRNGRGLVEANEGLSGLSGVAILERH